MGPELSETVTQIQENLSEVRVEPQSVIEGIEQLAASTPTPEETTPAERVEDDSSQEEQETSEPLRPGEETAMATVMTRSLRVRRMPVENSTVIFGLNEGDVYGINGWSTDSLWIRLVIPESSEGEGWVRTRFLMVEGNITEIPIVELPASVTITDTDTSTETVRLTEAPVGYALIQTGSLRLRVRKEPDADSRIVGHAHANEIFRILDYSADGEWVRIAGAEGDGLTDNPNGGWISRRFTLLNDPTMTATIALKNTTTPTLTTPLATSLTISPTETQPETQAETNIIAVQSITPLGVFTDPLTTPISIAAITEITAPITLSPAVSLILTPTYIISDNLVSDNFVSESFTITSDDILSNTFLIDLPNNEISQTTQPTTVTPIEPATIASSEINTEISTESAHITLKTQIITQVITGATTLFTVPTVEIIPPAATPIIADVVPTNTPTMTPSRVVASPTATSAPLVLLPTSTPTPITLLPTPTPTEQLILRPTSRAVTNTNTQPAVTQPASIIILEPTATPTTAPTTESTPRPRYINTAQIQTEGGRLRVRSEANSTSEIVGYVLNGEVYPVLEQSEDRQWIRIPNLGFQGGIAIGSEDNSAEDGWVSKQFVVIIVQVVEETPEAGQP
ncbi:MAG: SH3 domain-containing protein [Chloroflexota bacterium]